MWPELGPLRTPTWGKSLFSFMVDPKVQREKSLSLSHTWPCHEAGSGFKPVCRELQNPPFSPWIKWPIIYIYMPLGSHFGELQKDSICKLVITGTGIVPMPAPVAISIHTQGCCAGRSRKKKNIAGSCLPVQCTIFSYGNNSMITAFLVHKRKSRFTSCSGLCSCFPFWSMVNKLLCFIPTYPSPKP